MEPKGSTFWKKSEENLAVSEHAVEIQYYNAAASRYYYALVLAGCALFENYGAGWDWTSGRHTDFNKSIAGLLETKGYGDKYETFDALEEARVNRVRADYEPFPVLEYHFNKVKTLCQPIWEALESELK